MKVRASLSLRSVLILGFWGLASLPSCAAPVAFADWERGADFAPGKTFAVTKSAELNADLDERQKSLVTLVNTTIERELTLKGFAKAPADTAQLVVNFYVVRRTRQEVKVESRLCYAGDRGELPPGTSWDSAAIACEESLVSEYEEGTLIIDVFDAKKQELVWHGWKSRKVLPPDSPELSKVVEQATVDILSIFPPT
jgi:hypothetical protein